MAFEMLLGLNVTDEVSYQAYREAMTPILQAHNGGFGYDFRIAEVLQSETDGPINRVFTIHFPDKQTMEKFFSNVDYMRVREKYFEPAVESTTRIAAYET